MTATEVTADLRLEDHRRDLTAHCRRILRSPFDAEDAVQETLVLAWRAVDRFEGRAALRTWLHRIATNVCLDMLRVRRRVPLPVDPATVAATHAAAPMSPRAGGRPDGASAVAMRTWPSPDGRGGAAARSPEDVAVDRDATRRAFVVLLQLLPPRQRAVLILREVFRWRAAEVAELLGTTVASVNSALQRARATLAARAPVVASDLAPADAAQGDLLTRHVDALAHHDVRSLLALATAGGRG
jgi:RNA polymerase sigma-70 factor (ECF subfamily)